MDTAVLQRPTLVLNRHWQPVRVTTVARALVQVWNATARVIDPVDYRLYTWADWSALRPRADEAAITTPRLRLRVPEVVTLTTYDRLPILTVPFNRRNVFQRDRYACQYCGARPGSVELTIDHVVPRSQGGVSSWENCVLACVTCNRHKANRTPEQAGLSLRTKPVRPRWQPLYALGRVRIDNRACSTRAWSQFLSAAYWHVELTETA
jgi:5-methylcytosine-specific restriction endonuclease McrA